MAIVDTWTGRLGILGWRDGRRLPVADGNPEFPDTERQMLLRLPGQHDFGVMDSTAMSSSIKIGIQVGF